MYVYRNHTSHCTNKENIQIKQFHSFKNLPLYRVSGRCIMATLEVELERNLSRGDKKVNGFSGAIRSLENLGLEVGDEFTFPETYEVYEQKIGDNKAQYIMVVLKNGNAKPFYPSTFTKSRTVYNEDKTSTGVRKHTMGTAAELFRSFADVQKGMDALKGKTVKVTNIEQIDTLRFDRDTLMKAQIPTIDLVQ